MSAKATAWVASLKLKHKSGVLWAVANRANKLGETFASVGLIASDASVTRSTAFEIIATYERAGLLRRQVRYNKLGRSSSIIVLDLTVGPEIPDAPAEGVSGKAGRTESEIPDAPPGGSVRDSRTDNLESISKSLNQADAVPRTRAGATPDSDGQSPPRKSVRGTVLPKLAPEVWIDLAVAHGFTPTEGVREYADFRKAMKDEHSEQAFAPEWELHLLEASKRLSRGLGGGRIGR